MTARQRRSASDLTFAAPTGVHRVDPGKDAPVAVAPAAVEVEERADEAVPVGLVAANPLNSREVDARPDKVTKLGQSIAENGQLQPSAVVTREAFLNIFPEYEKEIGRARWVQITGARRRAAILERGLPTIDIVVKNDRAQSRQAFVAATAAENLDRENYDPIEEAKAVQHLVTEFGTVRAVAAHMGRSPGWVTQRTNLLKLHPEVQAALRVDDDEDDDAGLKRLPLRDVRTWHDLAPAAQLKELELWRRKNAVTTAGESGASKPTANSTQTRLSRTAAAIRKLGSNPVEIATTLRAELPPDELHALAQELLRAE